MVGVVWVWVHLSGLDAGRFEGLVEDKSLAYRSSCVESASCAGTSDHDLRRPTLSRSSGHLGGLLGGSRVNHSRRRRL